jgi:hypothetical protein
MHRFVQSVNSSKCQLNIVDYLSGCRYPSTRCRYQAVRHRSMAVRRRLLAVRHRLLAVRQYLAELNKKNKCYHLKPIYKFE